MLNFLKSLFWKKYNTGLIPDPRLASDKELDYLHEEIAGAPAPVYKTGMLNLNQYPDESQYHTSSCIAHGTTMAATKGSPRLSKMFVYRSRFNFPNEGMWLQNAGDILKNSGSCLYINLPTPDTEETANNIVISGTEKEEAAKNKIGNYVQMQSPDIDKIAAVVSQGTPVSIIIYATYQEWAKSYPSLEDNPNFNTAPIRHCVCVVDAFTDNGQKYLKIQDSAWFGGMSVRYLSETFIKTRCYGSLYFTKLSPGTGTRPDHIFNVDMKTGDDNEEVKWLQKRLMFEGTFPLVQEATGYFGGITLKAVMDYQKVHGLPWTGFCGPMTRQKLNNS